jgi:hypothetical protein
MVEALASDDFALLLFRVPLIMSLGEERKERLTRK